MAAPQVPLANGTDDATFHRLFKPIMEKVVQVFQPGAVVLQCGAPIPSRKSTMQGFCVQLKGCSRGVHFLQNHMPFRPPMLTVGRGLSSVRCEPN